MFAEPVHFLLNGQKVTLTELNPNTTILQYLREHLYRVGTKEGCAAGDCGACTVAICELVEGKLEYRSVNACITLMISVHGKQLITVEDLKQNKRLHPVQQSMVDCHGSQCGFCTPGFVMSLFALQKKHPSPNRQQILESLSGNLCRCTGYRSIIDAGLCAPSEFDFFDQHAEQTISRLSELDNEKPSVIEQEGNHAFYPKSVAQLADLLTEYPDARLVAGGTDLALEITQNLKQFDVLISTLGVKELCQINQSSMHISIGAALSYSTFKSFLELYYPAWVEMIERLGSLQVRNIGTLGGNIANASPIGDMAPVLLTLNASMTLRTSTGKRELPLDEFFIDYKVTALRKGEFIQSIKVPKPTDQETLHVYKVSKRFEDDISAVLGAFNIEMVEDRIHAISIAYGGMAATPKRAKHCEQALRGKVWNQTTLEQAMQVLEQDFSPMSDVRASSSYRLLVAKNLLRRAFLETNNSTISTKLTDHA